MIILQSESPEKTVELGRRVGRSLEAGHVVSLVGELGSGKTVFAKGVALGAGVEGVGVVTSPSYVLVNAYQGRLPLKHIDLYRLEGEVDLDFLGFSEFRVDSAILVEWGDRAPYALLGPHLRVEFEITGENGRNVRFLDKGISPNL